MKCGDERKQSFSLKERLYHQTFLKRKFNQRTKGVFYQERIVFCFAKKEARFVFLFPVLLSGEGIGNPEGGF